MHKILKHGQADIHYRIIGNGQPVVLIHGFGEDSSVWDPQVAFLKEKFQLILPDLPGCGQSAQTSDQAADWSMEFLASCIKKLLDSEVEATKSGLKKAIPVIGHSMGGYIALAFAEKYPESITALGLFHSTAFADNEAKKEARQKSIAFIQQHGGAAFIAQATPGLFSDGFKAEKPDIVAEITHRFSNLSGRSLVHYYEAMIARPDRTAILKTFKGPVLFIMGAHDKAVPMEQGLQQCHWPSLSYIQVLENAGHMGMLEETDRCNRFLEKFLQEIEITAK